MAGLTTGITKDANFMNLKEIGFDNIRQEVHGFLIEGEEIVAAYQTVRDQVIFTTMRIFVVNVQGLTGTKVSYFAYPYSKIQYYGIETAGLLDIDSEIVFVFSNGTVLQFDFKANVDIRRISNLVSRFIL